MTALPNTDEHGRSLRVRSWSIMAAIMVFGLIFSASAFAATFNPALVISDDNMRAYDSMSQPDIQAFLSAQTGPLKSMSFPRHDKGTSAPASTIIWEACQNYHISPAVMLTLLQKEQTLVTRTTEEMVRTVPQSLREAALALGYPRWRTSLQIVLRTALGGIVTGVLVAVARVAGETAPLLFTALGNQFWSTKLTQPIAALPLQIFTYAISPYDDWHAQAWAGALVLIALVLVISVIARFVTRGGHAGGHD